ncbi:hypothetical protein FWH09_01475, partial [Candidatus Saccharibacteria bacterium]|nr:hypothetical protein [Candidatus Saccharibacteria bacterium]
MEEANRDLDFRGMGCPVELGNDGGASLDEVILLDKPAGISSFGCVARVRGYYRARLSTKKVKVGHSGTLDPFATGLLIILVGKATKRQDEYMGMDKVYEATMKLGEISSTGDPEGEIREYEGIALTKDRRQTFTATSLSDDPCPASQILMQA